MRHDIRPLYEGARIVGRAATMLVSEVFEVPAEPYKLELELLDSLEPGEVVVLHDPGLDRAAVWGELLSTHARARGGRGVRHRRLHAGHVGDRRDALPGVRDRAARRRTRRAGST